MKALISHRIQTAAYIFNSLTTYHFLLTQIMLTSSWANRQAEVIKAPVIMVMVLGKANSTMRQDIENNIVARLKKEGFKAVPASDIFQPGVKHDSAELVNTLRKIKLICF